MATSGAGRHALLLVPQQDKQFSVPHADLLLRSNHGRHRKVTVCLVRFTEEGSTGIEERGRRKLLSSSVLLKSGDTASKQRRGEELVKRKRTSSHTEQWVHYRHHGAVWHGTDDLSHHLLEREVRKLVEVWLRFRGAWLAGTSTLDLNLLHAANKEALVAKEALVVVCTLVATCEGNESSNELKI